ncbi:MAG: hypothetical protein QOI63_1725, partial [Thermoplasmata archaeon]|nr:hypothetical protein [Thermoplasmata archaeon]
GRGAAIACLSAAGVLLGAAASAWGTVLASAAAGAAPALLATLLGPFLAVPALLLAATGAACLLLPRGRLDPVGQRLLADAERHHAGGGLSREGFQATRERVHARAARQWVPQAALTLSLFGASLALLAFALAGGFLALLPRAGSGAAVGVAGACAAAAVAGTLLVLAQAARWRARARSEASALQRMLADLESDILDEVRRNAPPSAAEPVPAEA